MSSTTLSKCKKDEPVLTQQSFHNVQPFRIQCITANGLTSPSIPVSGIALIAFLAMQVGVNPRSVHAFVLLSRFVRSRPIAFAIPPESGEGETECDWRLGRGQRLVEFVESHS